MVLFAYSARHARLARMQKTNTYSINIKKLPKSEIEIAGEITWEHLVTFEDAAFVHLAEHLTLDGFRKGNIPKEVARKHIPDELLLSDMAERAIQDIYPTLLTEENLDIIGRPQVAITKIARGDALGFSLSAAVVPEIPLHDYKKIAKDTLLETPKEITDEDVEKVVENLRQMRAYGHVHEEGNDHTHEEPLPEVNDAFAKSFGSFETVADMRAKIRENLVHEAEAAVKDKRRFAIMEEIVKHSIFEVPGIVLSAEKEKMLAQIEADVARSGTSLEDYLKHIQKTKEELMTEFAPEAEKRARFQLVLNAIARAEKALPTEEEVEAEAQKLVQMYPGADLQRTKAYADMLLTNEKVLGMLESQ